MTQPKTKSIEKDARPITPNQQTPPNQRPPEDPFRTPPRAPVHENRFLLNQQNQFSLRLTQLELSLSPTIGKSRKERAQARLQGLSLLSLRGSNESSFAQRVHENQQSTTEQQVRNHQDTVNQQGSVSPRGTVNHPAVLNNQAVSNESSSVQQTQVLPAGVASAAQENSQSGASSQEENEEF